MRSITTPDAPAAIGTYSQAVRAGDTVYLTDLANFTKVNEVMASYFAEPYPARAAIGVASLPRGSAVEVDAIMFLGSREEALAPLAAAEAVPQGSTK
jgi:enamine deaminase RidA (YjgF/YER057c/UK114 family)